MLAGVVALGANAKDHAMWLALFTRSTPLFTLTSDRVPHKPQCCFKVATSTCVCSTPQWI